MQVVIKKCLSWLTNSALVYESKCGGTRSVADPGCLSRILIFVHSGSRISDPGSRNSNKREGKKNFCCPTFFVATKITKSEIILILNWWRKKIGPFYKELQNFLPKKLSLSSQKYGFEIRDPGSGKTYSGSRIRIRNMGTCMGGGGGYGVSVIEDRCEHHVTWSPKKLWRSNVYRYVLENTLPPRGGM